MLHVVCTIVTVVGGCATVVIGARVVGTVFAVIVGLVEGIIVGEEIVVVHSEVVTVGCVMVVRRIVVGSIDLGTDVGGGIMVVSV
jgi:hypothetical protein